MVAGGIFVFQTEVHIEASRFHRNIGFYGGGISISAGARLVIPADTNTQERTQFSGNEAVNGGGLLIAFGASAELEGVDFVNNVGYAQGGAIACHSGTNGVSVFGGLFKGNRGLIGGGINAYYGGNVSIGSHLGTATRFEDNIASSGGAMYVGNGHTILTGVYIEDTIFSGNIAANIDDPRIPKVGVLELELNDVVSPIEAETSDDEIRRAIDMYNGYMSIPEGTGGALALSLENVRPFMSGDIYLSNVSINNNVAIVGGGIGVYMSDIPWNREAYDRCLARVFRVYDCKRFILHNVRVKNNVAQFGGGIFVTHPTSIDLTCNLNDPNNRMTLHEAMSTKMAQIRDLDFREDLFCADIRDNKISGQDITQGSDVGTNAVTLSFNRSEDVLQETVSGEPLTLSCDNKEDESCDTTVRISIKDAFNQTIHGGIKDSSLTIALSSPFVLGDRRYTARNGVAEINNTFAFGINVSSLLRISSVGRNQVEIQIPFSIRGCYPGEYTHNRRCLECPPRQYGFNGSREQCETCDSHAVCEGGAALVPEDGYWHSTPFSPQFHPCLFSGACTYDQRTDKLTEFYNNTRRLQEQLNQLELFLSDGGEQPTFSGYEQCAEGYESVLCGSCEPGYGRSINGECSKCPKKRRSFGLGVVSFAFILVLIGVNAIITIVSAETRIELRQLELRDRETSKNDASGVHSNTRENGATFSQGASQAEGFTHTNPCTETDEEQKTKQRLVSTVVLSETFKILLNYLQITSAALRLQVQWNAPMNGLLSVEAFAVGIASNTFSAPTECLLEITSVEHPSIAALWIRLLKPTAGLLFLIAVFSIVWLTLRVKRRARNGPGHGNTLRTSWTTGAIITTLVAIYFSYIDVAREFLRTVNCIDVDVSEDLISNHPYEQYATARRDDIWVEDTNLRCFQGAHKLTGILGIAGLTLSLLVIVFIVVWPRMNKRHQADPVFIARYSFLYQGYRDAWYTRCWEAAILIRKALKAAVIVFGVRLGPNLQATMCVGILVLALMLQTVIRPFRVTNLQNVPEYSGRLFSFCGLHPMAEKWRQINNSLCLNILESFSLFCSTTVFFTAVVLNDSNASRSGERAIIVFTFVLNVSYVLYMIFRLYAAFHVVADLKLEASKPPTVEANTNRAGVVGLVGKGRSVLKVMYGKYKDSKPTIRRASSDALIECTEVQPKNTTSLSEITTDP